MPEKIGKDVIQKRLTEFGFPVVKTRLRFKSKEDLIKELSRKTVSDVWYTGNMITLNFDGERLSNTIKILRHEEWVGSWNKKGKPIIYIDNDLPEKYREYIAIHETVEKYLAERYRLDPDAEAHEIAEEVEKRFFLKELSSKEWDEYSKIVERIHRKELKHRR